MILDDRGKAPNFVVIGNQLVHQPTGTKVHVASRSKYAMKVAMRKLKQKLEDNPNEDA